MAHDLTATWKSLYNLGGTPKCEGTVNLSEGPGGKLGGLSTDNTTMALDNCKNALKTRIDGKHLGSSVSFNKACIKCRFFPIPRLFGIDIFRLENSIFRIQHEGQVSEDGSEISGTWQHPSGKGGTFFYYRIPPAGEVREEDVEVKKVIPIAKVAEPTGIENCACPMGPS